MCKYFFLIDSGVSGYPLRHSASLLSTKKGKSLNDFFFQNNPKSVQQQIKASTEDG